MKNNFILHCSWILLETFKETNIIQDREKYQRIENPQIASTINSIVRGFYLYFTSYEDIELGDWYLNQDRVPFQCQKSNLPEGFFKHCKKIIATNNPDVAIDKENELYTTYSESYKHVVPNISDDTIDEFMECLNNIVSISSVNIKLEHLGTDVFINADNTVVAELVKPISKIYTEADMLKAAKYGYEFRATTQFPEQAFEDSCINNTKQWLTTLNKIL